VPVQRGQEEREQRHDDPRLDDEEEFHVCLDDDGSFYWDGAYAEIQIWVIKRPDAQ
jgi:hypothetical protein